VCLCVCDSISVSASVSVSISVWTLDVCMSMAYPIIGMCYHSEIDATHCKTLQDTLIHPATHNAMKYEGERERARSNKRERGRARGRLGESGKERERAGECEQEHARARESERASMCEKSVRESVRERECARVEDAITDIQAPFCNAQNTFLCLFP